MYKILLIAASLIIAACPMSQGQSIANRQFTDAQGVAGTGWTTMDQNRTSDVTMTQRNDTFGFYLKPPDNTHTQTTMQNSYQNNFRAGPLPTVTSMPYIGTNVAPGNFAARQWGGGILYPTVLDSIVAESGWDFMVFGDEGTEGPPPLDDFGTIDAGVFATTGHPSDAPSSWGWPN